MAIDTPARLAIIGAGPLGLEAALYARFLGYAVIIYERGEVATNVRPAADKLLDTPFQAISTTLGIAAIEAQDDSYVPPTANDLLTGQEWLNRYLLPLSQTDLLADHLRLHTTVIAVESRPHAPREESISRSEMPTMFHLSSRDAAGNEQSEPFDGILECTGSEDTATWQPPEDMAQYYHLLGEKNPAATPPFRLADGHNQIRQAFAIIGERETLDLYASAHRLLKSYQPKSS